MSNSRVENWLDDTVHVTRKPIYIHALEPEAKCMSTVNTSHCPTRKRLRLSNDSTESTAYIVIEEDTEGRRCSSSVPTSIDTLSLISEVESDDMFRTSAKSNDTTPDFRRSRPRINMKFAEYDSPRDQAIFIDTEAQKWPVKMRDLLQSKNYPMQNLYGVQWVNKSMGLHETVVYERMYKIMQATIFCTKETSSEASWGEKVVIKILDLAIEMTPETEKKTIALNL